MLDPIRERETISLSGEGVNETMKSYYVCNINRRKEAEGDIGTRPVNGIPILISTNYFHVSSSNSAF